MSGAPRRAVAALLDGRAVRLATMTYPLGLLALLGLVWMLEFVGGSVQVASWGNVLVASAAIASIPAVCVFALLRALEGQEREALAGVQDVLDRYQSGDSTARTHSMSSEAIGLLGRSIDGLLDRQQIGGLPIASATEQLNESVIEIMRAVGEIAATKDLGIKVPVGEDVTGSIADALNLQNEEISRVLGSVARVSRQVGQATLSVRNQSESAVSAAGRERHEVELAARELGRAAAALNAIAERARACNELAEQAVRTTVASVRHVNDTVDGVSESRELIRETEKRIKRLGERSQEIGRIVGLIQGISERTGILALNASMHAVAAGEAGRNFLTVADQVKRLSESARDAGGDIARLVVAIQTETQETVLAMNGAISKIVEISALAEDAGQGMLRSQACTESLASSVREIARTSIEQAKVGAGLQERARIIQEASSETARQLTSQSIETRRLADYAKVLVQEVSVFKLSAADRDELSPARSPEQPVIGSAQAAP